ncbi:serine/threonine-protein kinase [Prosthecobacter sp.]|uniref:serine/threonine-protein kinase n=1 Tax=Prosthecobacter sp. TaxID=1965333 RepID=UPI002ABB727E|nr:serine/threonine-protein kinase [Prosthecobacter sp.]MDZ4404281.1 serine/threonine-protein kinase [Prosthecobacter sp.]
MAEEASSSDPLSFDVPSIEEMTGYLPQFKFEKLAACGGMGAVYKAWQDSLARWVAVKILPPKFGAEQGFADRFKTEARAMAKLNHTNIVGVYDFGITPGGHLFLVMEWIEGRSLHDLIHKTNLPLRKATNLAMQLCEALSFAHQHGIIHRDIKPGNIMVNDADHVKVADFGLARPTNETEEDNPMGTPDYAAPEIRGGSVTDHRVDIFAAGVVLYEMLTGRVPETPRRPVTLYAKISSRWDEIIAKAIHPDPEKRYQDAGEFRAYINAAMKQESGVSPPDTADHRPKGPPQKKAAAMTQKQQMGLTLGFVGLVLVALLALIFWPTARKTAATSAGAAEATPEEIQQVIVTLEKSDPELTRLLNSFADDWAASGAGKSSATAEKLRAALNTAMQAKTKDRAEAARRAEIVTAELARLQGAPSLKALKQNAAK